VTTGKFVLLLFFLSLFILPSGCRQRGEAFVIGLGDNIRTIDPIGSPSVDAASERVRQPHQQLSPRRPGQIGGLYHEQGSRLVFVCRSHNHG